MSFLTIGGGPSVSLYTKSQITKLAESCFTITVNDSAFKFPCDCVCAGDFMWILDNKKRLMELGKPIITREWGVLSTSNLDLIVLPNEISLFARLSGMISVKLLDSMAGGLNDMAYCIGIDHTPKHYYDDKSDCTKSVELSDYASLVCRNTINLGHTSKIECWPKESKIPVVKELSYPDRRKCNTIIRTLSNHLIRENL